MSSWSGNTYNRAKELPKQLAELDEEELAEYGRNKINKSFMSNYNYSSADMDELAMRNNKLAISHKSYKLNKHTKYA